jgi:hypothetical protein
MAHAKPRPYLIQTEVRGFFLNDERELASLAEKMRGHGHGLLGAEVDTSTSLLKNFPGVIRVLSQGVYSENYDFARFAAETHKWANEKLGTIIEGEHVFSVVVKTLELRFDVDFDEEIHTPSESDLEDAGMEADAKN